MHIFICRW